METEKQIDALNQLIEINNDRLEGYETAAGETGSADLQTLFGNMKSTSYDNLQELREEVSRLNGQATEGTKVTGKFFRVWMDVKAALSTNDRQTVLNSCEFGEDKALETYEDVLENNSGTFSAEQIAMVKAQQANLRADHDRIKALRDAE